MTIISTTISSTVTPSIDSRVRVECRARPAAVSRLATSAARATGSPAAVRPMPGWPSAGSIAAYSSSQDSGTRITPPFRMRG